MTGQIDLVPARECGACNACCTHLLITDPAMNKMPGDTCRHWQSESGCGIYSARPSACRQYHCGWRCLADLGDSWRPDRSGILINIRSQPGETPTAHLVVIGGEATAKGRQLAGLAASMIDGGTAVHLVMPGPAGTPGHRALLNPLIAQAVAARSIERVQAVLAQLYDGLPGQPQPVARPASVPDPVVRYGFTAPAGSPARR